MNHEIKSKMLEVVCEVVGALASEWIRELWIDYDEELLIPLSQATSTSLPHEEGLKNVFEKLVLFSEKELSIYAFSCLYRFRSNLVLDWLELKNIEFNDNWGRLAALCYPKWDRMKGWLDKGRPLSLIALDTMVNCIIIGSDPLVERYQPKILDTSKDEISSVLKNYYQIDTVPRVRNRVNSILDNDNEIFNFI